MIVTWPAEENLLQLLTLTKPSQPPVAACYQFTAAKTQLAVRQRYWWREREKEIDKEEREREKQAQDGELSGPPEEPVQPSLNQSNPVQIESNAAGEINLRKQTKDYISDEWKYVTPTAWWVRVGGLRFFFAPLSNKQHLNGNWSNLWHEMFHIYRISKPDLKPSPSKVSCSKYNIKSSELIWLKL